MKHDAGILGLVMAEGVAVLVFVGLLAARISKRSAGRSMSAEDEHGGVLHVQALWEARTLEVS
jgi:drug/metabolite transporter superfamily protein YnfA